jgi:hypothetical protein
MGLPDGSLISILQTQLVPLPIARAAFALTNDETAYKNGMVVFGSIGELRREELKQI